VVFENNL